MDALNLSQKIVSKPCLRVLGIAWALVISGCGGGSGSGDMPGLLDDSFSSVAEPELSATLPEDASLVSQNEPAVSVNADGLDSLVVAAALDVTELPFEDPINMVDVHSLTTLADTGIRIGFKGDIQADSVDALFIESSWTDMQTCLGVVGMAPMVIISSDTIVPLSNADDVLFHFDGSITATSTAFATGVTVQVSELDLNGAFNRIGFNLRSIMGRYLWASANLPERDYPHSCASQG